MIKALLLVFDTGRAWDGVFRARHSTSYVLFVYLLPMLLITSVVEGFGLVKWGEPQSRVAYVRHFTVAEAGVFLGLQLALTLVVVFVSAWIIRNLGETFHGRHTYNQCFTVVAYGLSPMLTLRLLDAFTVSPWIPWAAGIIISLAILYHGVPRIMMPDPPHAFGLYLTSSLMLILATGLARFVTAWYLMGKFEAAKPVESVRHLLHFAL
ncbi:MAG TPA: Yip1 family protein [Verrucomicrobiota bacterium]|nr:Yip1 family protein [Verrucomicrobiota bacterium]